MKNNIHVLSLLDKCYIFWILSHRHLIVPRLIIKIVTNSFLRFLASPPLPLPPSSPPFLSPLIEMFPLRHCVGGGKEIPSNIPHSPFI
jgi:hypothetical protein